MSDQHENASSCPACGTRLYFHGWANSWWCAKCRAWVEHPAREDRAARAVHWCCGLCALMALALAGCAQVTARTIRLDVPRGEARLVSVRTTPGWQFWDKPVKAWEVNQDGRVQFVPINAAREDLLGELAGPLGTVASHITIPVTPGP